MNVRVLTPSVIKPLSKLHSPMGRQLPKKSVLDRIKKDLFGPVNQEDAKIFIQRELTKSQREATKRWGFDFSRGEPVQDHGQFVWKRVPPAVMPQMYTLSRAAHCREIPTCSDASDSEDVSPDQELMDSRAHNEHRQPEMTPACSTSRCLKKDKATRQPKITEFLKERKRLAPTPVKKATTASGSAAKRMRFNNLSQ
ncbi:cyclin-dependent kinase inhibitor 1 [Phlebotomus argentipes]|uniref:cyclin-dependent kinase inhibitor 1 n=1 Tax=Phlebotomus argentipes TaxID=94469 RepID=UPI0028931102|nr:cyclin-dependent kinase inhibitor 1 [Phlebotomus argentipes]